MNNEKLYAKGFNNGYILAKHTPDIYSVIEKGIKPQTDYLEGFISGGKEYEIEKNAPSKQRDRDRNIEHDR